MDRYQLALYAHFVALVAAVSASSILHLNFVRLRRATRVQEAWDAAGALARVAPVMPLFAFALFATGAYLVHLRWPWSQGWVIAGIVGLVSMPLSAVVVVKPRLQALGRRLADAKGAALDDDLVAATRDSLVWGAMHFNHVMALAVMFIMATKPGLAGSFVALLAAPLVGAWAALSSAKTAQPERRESTAPAAAGD
jgi:hypothetical protein